MKYSLNEKKNEFVYYTFSGGLYYMKAGKPETLVLLDENVTSFEYADPDLKNIFYLVLILMMTISCLYSQIQCKTVLKLLKLL